MIHSDRISRRFVQSNPPCRAIAFSFSPEFSEAQSIRDCKSRFKSLRAELDSTLRSFRARQAASYSTPLPEKHPASANGFTPSASDQSHSSNHTQTAQAPFRTPSKTFDLNEAPDRPDGAGPSGRSEARGPRRGHVSGTLSAVLAASRFLLLAPS